MNPTPFTADQAIEIFRAAADANNSTAVRDGNLVMLNSRNAKDVLLTGDLHGHEANYEGILRKADLEKNPERHLIFQEICHGGPQFPEGGCVSHRMLTRVAEMKVRYPQRVHHIMSNHELAELTRYPIQKNRQLLNTSFALGMFRDYGTRADEVRFAMFSYLETCPLAVSISNHVFLSHSIPDQLDSRERPFDETIFYRALDPGSDLIRDGSVYRLVWGRDYRQTNADLFAKMLQAEILVCGHEPCPEGFKFPNSRQAIIDCSGQNAYCMLIPTADRLTQWNYRTYVLPVHSY